MEKPIEYEIQKTIHPNFSPRTSKRITINPKNTSSYLISSVKDGYLKVSKDLETGILKETLYMKRDQRK